MKKVSTKQALFLPAIAPGQEVKFKCIACIRKRNLLSGGRSHRGKGEIANENDESGQVN
jgi:hypothetical protein